MLGDDTLSLVGVEVVEVSLGHRFGTMLLGYLVHHGDRRLRQNGDRRHHQLELVAGPRLTKHQQGFVLPRQQHVTETALGKAGGGTAGA